MAKKNAGVDVPGLYYLQIRQVHAVATHRAFPFSKPSQFGCLRPASRPRKSRRCLCRDNRVLGGCPLQIQYLFKIPILLFLNTRAFPYCHTRALVSEYCSDFPGFKGFSANPAAPQHLPKDLSSETGPKDDILDSRDGGSYYFDSYSCWKRSYKPEKSCQLAQQ